MNAPRVVGDLTDPRRCKFRLSRAALEAILSHRSCSA
jgi:hypothetical protein